MNTQNRTIKYDDWIMLCLLLMSGTYNHWRGGWFIATLAVIICYVLLATLWNWLCREDWDGGKNVWKEYHERQAEAERKRYAEQVIREFEAEKEQQEKPSIRLNEDGTIDIESNMRSDRAQSLFSSLKTQSRFVLSQTKMTLTSGFRSWFSLKLVPIESNLIVPCAANTNETTTPMKSILTEIDADKLKAAEAAIKAIPTASDADSNGCEQKSKIHAINLHDTIRIEGVGEIVTTSIRTIGIGADTARIEIEGSFIYKPQD